MYTCTNCNSSFKKWYGQCPTCKQWNVIEEQVISQHVKVVGKVNEITTLQAVDIEKTIPVPTGIDQLDLVLGGGLVKGSLCLFGGHPGIGKSTLLLQLASNLSTNVKVLYVSGEESLGQIKIRANRLSANPNINFLSGQNIQDIISTSIANKVEVLIIDSVQTAVSSNGGGNGGSVSQLKLIAFELMEFAKSTNTTVIIIGHVTKDGDIAGPKLLEHMVDTVVYLESDQGNLRILRSEKNRFGSTSEIGILAMGPKGLSSFDPNRELPNTQGSNIGAARSGFCTGNRSILIEIQSLVTNSPYPSPKRSSQGVDVARLNIISALVQKYGKVTLTYDDIYLKLQGGFKVSESTIDLGLIASLYSAKEELPIPCDWLFIGEVALTGEVLGTSQLPELIKAGLKLGYKRIFCAKSNGHSQVEEITHIEELIRFIRRN